MWHTRSKNFLIIGLVVSIILVAGCTSVQDEKLNDCNQREYFNFTIPANSGLIGSYKMYFSIDDKINNNVYGSYNLTFFNVKEATTENVTIYYNGEPVITTYNVPATKAKAEFMVLDQKNYNSLIDGITPTKYYSDNREGIGYFTFVPDHTDYYKFTIDNSYSEVLAQVGVIGVWEYCKKA